MKLLLDALTKFLCGLLIVSLLLFLPAGSLNYSGGIRFLMLMFVPIFIMGICLFIKSPELLKRRLDSKEKESTQKGVVVFSALIFLFGFIVAGLDFRFGWSKMPKAVVTISSVLFLVSYLIYAEVIRENVYLSRKIEVVENQTVISTGLYSLIRHPMYFATILMFLTIPFILGSWWAVLCFAVYPVLIAVRINNEERVLTDKLEGYLEYKQKVKYKIIPFIW